MSDRKRKRLQFDSPQRRSKRTVIVDQPETVSALEDIACNTEEAAEYTKEAADALCDISSSIQDLGRELAHPQGPIGEIQKSIDSVETTLSSSNDALIAELENTTKAISAVSFSLNDIFNVLQKIYDLQRQRP